MKSCFLFGFWIVILGLFLPDLLWCFILLLLYLTSVHPYCEFLLPYLPGSRSSTLPSFLPHLNTILSTFFSLVPHTAHTHTSLLTGTHDHWLELHRTYTCTHSYLLVSFRVGYFLLGLYINYSSLVCLIGLGILLSLVYMYSDSFSSRR